MSNKSIIIDRLDRCLVCHTYQNIEIHHCLHGTANRKLADKYKLIVPLCNLHHRGTNGVHGKNGRILDRKLKEQAQKAFEYHYGTREDFIKTFGRSYL